MTWFDTISKKKEKGMRKGMRKLEDALLAEGYKIVESGKGKGKHVKITVKRLSEVENPNAEVVQTTVSHTIASGRKNAAMVVNEIANKFTGRKRRGQGSFKLSNDKTNTWQSILKSSNPLSPDFVVPEIPDRIVRKFGASRVKDTELLLNSYPNLKRISEVKGLGAKIAGRFLGGDGMGVRYVDGKANYYNGLGVKYVIITDELTKDLHSGINPLTIIGELKDFMDKFTNYFVSFDEDYEERRKTSKIFVDSMKVFMKNLLLTVGSSNTVGSQSKDKLSNEMIAESIIEFKNTKKLQSLEDIIQQRLKQKMEENNVFDISQEEFENYISVLYGEHDEWDEEYKDLEETIRYRNEEGAEDFAEGKLEEGLRNRRNTNG